jgi:pSer/pThr/pTyr-binding forkhead associated (FHA) protein
MSQCPTCGAMVADTAQMCEDCGTDLTQSVASSSSPALNGNGNLSPSAPPVSAMPLSATDSTPAGGAVSLSQDTARLELKRSGTLTGDSFQVASGVIIGRFDVDTGPVDLDLSSLPESQHMSRQHAKMSQNDAGQWTVTDLGSSNGTFVLDTTTGKFTRVSGDCIIADGAEIAFGNARFVFRCQ